MARLNFAESIKKLFGSHQYTDKSFFEDLSDSLIEGDIGPKMAYSVVEELEKQCKSEGITDHDGILNRLESILSPYIRATELVADPDRVSVFLILGVNGVGKTTSAAKLARWYLDNRPGTRVVLAAADTFRAAAIEQLKHHGESVGVQVVAHQHGGDPSAVVFDSADSVRAQGGGLVIADTAGRLHNKENLVRELQKIDRIAKSKADEGCYRKILVLDATTGQNGLRQAEVFHEAVGVDAIILTKYDSTARGGIAIAAGKDLGIPVAFVGTGERYSDFAPFEPHTYLAEFIGKK